MERLLHKFYISILFVIDHVITFCDHVTNILFKYIFGSQDCTATVKPSRGQTPVSLHQIQPNPGMIQTHGGYAISPEVVHHPPPHLSYRMMQPTFALPHHLTITGPGTRPVSISNDLGPPIFMPCKLLYLS